MKSPSATLRLPWSGAISLPSTLGALPVGRGDPSMVRRRDGFWFAARLPAGPCSVRIFFDTPGQLSATAWGPAAGEMLLRVPGLVGAEDDVSEFAPTHPLVRRLHRRQLGFRLSRTGFYLKSLVGTILGQKVTTVEAHRAWRLLLQRHGEPAPGPVALLTLPAPERLERLPGHAWTRLGVHRAQAATVSRAAAAAHHIEALAGQAPEAALQTLQRVRGIGPWTANNTLLQAAGWADAVPVGDYHIKNTIVWALAGRPRGTDEEMVALLAPFAPHRGRVVRLLKGSVKAPRFGPKTDVRPLPGHERPD